MKAKLGEQREGVREQMEEDAGQGEHTFPALLQALG